MVIGSISSTCSTSSTSSSCASATIITSTASATNASTSSTQGGCVCVCVCGGPYHGGWEDTMKKSGTYQECNPSRRRQLVHF